MDDPGKDLDTFQPRNYQVELMRISLEQNTIIYLPTGSGKTFIALLVLKAMSGALLKPYKAGGKVTVVLVNTVALVPQHAKYIKDHTLLSAGCYTGELKTDFWSREEWENEFNTYQVLIMTSQIFLNILNSKFIDLNRVNLIIFDECHRGVEEQPMRQVMKHFQYVNDQPRVLGLTATLLNGNCKLHRVMDEVRSLEATFHSKVATVEGLQQVIGHSTNPKEKFKICAPPVICSTLASGMAELHSALKILDQVTLDSPASPQIPIDDDLVPFDTKDVLKRLRNLIQDLVDHMQMLGIYGGHKACTAYMIQLVRVRKHCEDKKSLIILNFVITVMGSVREMFQTRMAGLSELEKIRRFSTDKVLRLLEILEEYHRESSEELCGLIFVTRRFTAKIVCHIIDSYRQHHPRMHHINANFMVGYHNNPYNDNQEGLFIAKKNREVMDSFANKEVNLLVSSSVLEEGVDIPTCTLVVKFDKCEEYRSYIQSKGRARHKSSWYYTIVEANAWDKFSKKLAEFREIETILNDFLIGKNDERSAPTQDEIDVLYNEDAIQPYFVAGPDSAQVNMSSAVSLLSRYCSTLPSDIYTTYAPEWYLEKGDGTGRGRLRVVIVLPIICPLIDPIKGPYMHCRKNAKRAAALYACKALHKCGELDDHLLPVRQTVTEEDFSHLFGHYPEIKEPDAGNKKKKRLHDKQIAECVTGTLCPDAPLYLHAIRITPKYPRHEDANLAVIYDLYMASLGFGLLTPHPLPEIIKFPLYDSSGELKINVQTNVKTVVLNRDQIMALRRFHCVVLKDLLEVVKSFLILDNSGQCTEAMLLAPVQLQENLVDIDFAVLDEHQSIRDKSREPSSAEKAAIVVTEEDYLHKIVSPWYRTEPTMYVVTRVYPDKSPLSDFPNADYTNFVEYYQEKYYLSIQNTKQPLLLVKGLSKRLNMYKPTGAEKKRKREKRFEELEEYLVPELLVKQDFPAALWIKARCLPSILSRVSFILKLQQLRERIASDLRLRQTNNTNSPALELDRNLLHYEPDAIKFPMIDETLVAAANEANNILALEHSIVSQYCNKDFALKKLEAEYPWRKIDEPKDIERDMTVTVMDIEHYEAFVCRKAGENSKQPANESPSKSKALPAITYPAEFHETKIELLEIPYDRQNPDLCELYKAMTAAEANDIVNLERLETLGDSFLKLISSLYITLKFPLFNEGKSTSLKSRMVSNKNLFYLGRRKNLGGILKNSVFSPNEDWLPPCFTVPEVVKERISNKEYSVNSLFYFEIPFEDQVTGQLSPTTLASMSSAARSVAEDEKKSYSTMGNFLNEQLVSDKTLADSVEALIGVYYQSGGFKGALNFVEWLGIIPPSENLQALLDRPVPNPVLDPKATRENVLFHIPMWQELEKRLGYHFRDPGFLLQALTHSSYQPNRITRCYERLEFSGDAILDFLITSYIYEHCGYLNPGQITDLRSALVNNNTFASLVVRNGFHKFILMINSELQDHIDRFAKYFELKNYVIDDEVLILLEEEDLNLAEYVDVPKILGDIFEALAGAVYLDSGKDLVVVWKVFYKLMWREIDLFSKNVPINILRSLFECQVYPSFSKAVEADNKTMVALQFQCDGRKKRVYGFGTNKNMAKRAAAKIALRALKMSDHQR